MQKACREKKLVKKAIELIDKDVRYDD